VFVEKETIEELFRQIESFRSEVKRAGGNPSHPPISIDDMLLVASELLEMKIEVESVSFEAEHLYSLVERSKKSALISVRAGLPDEITRAAICKELCHLLFDHPDSWSTDVVETVSSLVEHRSLELADGEGKVVPKNQTVYVEEIASVSSTELLYPHEIRAMHRRMLDSQEISYRKLAMEMKLPHWMVHWPYAKWYKILETMRPSSTDGKLVSGVVTSSSSSEPTAKDTQENISERTQ